MMTKKLVSNFETEYRTLKLRLYPDKDQEILISKTFGCCRQIYNTRIFEKQTFYENIIKPEKDPEKRKELWKNSHFSTEKELKEQFDYLKEPSSGALVQARCDAEQAYTNFYASLSGKRLGLKMNLPRFKSKHSHDFSYRETYVYSKILNTETKTIKLSKIGEVKYRHDRINDWFLSNAILKSITVRKNSAGQYYACLLYEREIIRKPKVFSNSEKTIGLDFSPANLYINSEGQKCLNYVPQKQAHQKQLTKLQRRQAKKLKGGKNREKARLKVARLEHHIAQSRLDFIEKETLRLVQNYELIGIEDLNLKAMSKFLRNAKNLVDTSWGTFVTKLILKANKNENNCQVIKVDRFFPSSQLCSNCGFQNKDLTLANREWKCPKCGSYHNRDHNAAINIKKEVKKYC